LDLSNIDLLALQTKAMQSDPTTIGFCAALTPQLNIVSNQTDSILIYSNIDELPHEVLDILAWQFHIDWYVATAGIEIKRKLIKNCMKVHRSKGTGYAVEQVIEDMFGDGFVTEWFEYGGEAFHFKVITTNPSVTSELANQFNMAVNAVKRKSTVLEQIIISLSAELDIYYAGVVHTGDNLTIRQVV
jgi:phage tail P2-like protein